METSGGSGGNRGTSSGTGRVPEEGRGQQRDRTPEEMNWVDRRQTYIPSGTNQFGLCLRPGMPPGSGGSYCSKKAVPVIPATRTSFLIGKAGLNLFPGRRHSHPQRGPGTPKGETLGERTTSKACSPRTRTTCSARPVPTALVTVQMNVVLTSLSTEWMISWGPWATAEAGKTPAVLEGAGVTRGGHQGSPAWSLMTQPLRSKLQGHKC